MVTVVCRQGQISPDFVVGLTISAIGVPTKLDAAAAKHCFSCNFPRGNDNVVCDSGMMS